MIWFGSHLDEKQKGLKSLIVIANTFDPKKKVRTIENWSSYNTTLFRIKTQV